jgi:hypothetical protein
MCTRSAALDILGLHAINYCGGRAKDAKEI